VKTAFRKSFQRDLKTLKKSHEILARIRQKIEEVEEAEDLQEVASVKKLSGGGDYYRIRVGDYRIGLLFRLIRSFLYVACTAGISTVISHSRPCPA